MPVGYSTSPCWENIGAEFPGGYSTSPCWENITACTYNVVICEVHKINKKHMLLKFTYYLVTHSTSLFVMNANQILYPIMQINDVPYLANFFVSKLNLIVARDIVNKALDLVSLSLAVLH